MTRCARSEGPRAPQSLSPDAIADTRVRGPVPGAHPQANTRVSTHWKVLQCQAHEGTCSACLDTGWPTQRRPRGENGTTTALGGYCHPASLLPSHRVQAQRGALPWSGTLEADSLCGDRCLSTFRAAGRPAGSTPGLRTAPGPAPTLSKAVCAGHHAQQDKLQVGGTER